MKLLEALEILNKPVAEAAPAQEIFLLCGFTPLHLMTFLAAHLRVNIPTRRIVINTGLYGDLAGNLERLHFAGKRGTACIVIEWSDLDPRLGIRTLGSWRSTDVTDIVESARQQSERLAHLVSEAAEMVSLCVATPTLPLPPIFITQGSQAHNDQCKLQEIVASLAVSLSANRRIKLINPQRLDEVSPLCRRLNPKTEMSNGFPYNLEHASKVAELFATLIKDAEPRKGLITDLDDTLWGGTLGEVGVEGISWNLESGTHIHGLYQRFLSSLASAGVLLAVASKNEPALVEQAFTRSDILVPREDLFPLEVHWGPKSESIGRILKQWNIAPDDAVFIDDSPMEVAEVRASFPQIDALVFPKNDCVAIWELLKQLRDRFAKSSLSVEDKVRLRSIRNSAMIHELGQATGVRADNFLRNSEATIVFSSGPDVHDSRAFELINKTNQFNLNGKRLDQSEWQDLLHDPGAFLLTATYEDRYGPLGKIAVVMGKSDGSRLRVCSWVMSCRAFSRRIEHQCLNYLFEKMAVDEIVFDYQSTPRNGPIQNFFVELLGERASPSLSLRRVLFHAKSPALFHRVIEAKAD
jgi:FkbH-like protein